MPVAKEQIRQIIADWYGMLADGKKGALIKGRAGLRLESGKF